MLFYLFDGDHLKHDHLAAQYSELNIEMYATVTSKINLEHVKCVNIFSFGEYVRIFRNICRIQIVFRFVVVFSYVYELKNSQFEIQRIQPKIVNRCDLI